MDDVCHDVFVYGTLRGGFGNHRLLKGATCVAPVALTVERFLMVDCGYFPAVIAGPGSFADHRRARIVGEVYRVSDETFKLLDRLEGFPRHYQRFEVEWELPGTIVTGRAWMYVQGAVNGRPVIESGNWASVESEVP